MAVDIHPTAVIDKRAELDHDLTVGPYAIIGPSVRLGKGTVVGSHAVIEGNTTLGPNNTVYQFVSLGSAPQDLKFRGEDVRLEIGEGNVFREYSNINMGTLQGGGVTKIGNGNLVMSHVHIGHDCHIGDNVVIASATGLSGHVTIEDCAIIGGMIGVSQRVRIGKLAYIGGYTGIARDVPPFTLGRGINGIKIIIKGINSEGLRRRGYSPETILALKRVYKTIFLANDNIKDGCRIAKEKDDGTVPEVSYFIDFIVNSKCGIAATSKGE